MKKLFLSLAVALGVFTSAAAQEAGQMWAGGTVGLWSSKVKGGDSQLSFKVMPELGYNLTENVAVGIVIGAAHDHGGIGDLETITSIAPSLNYDGNALTAEGAINSYKVSPFLRYTFLKGDLGGLFVDAGVGYQWSKACGVELKENQLEIGLRPGIALNVSSKVALVSKFGFLGYQTAKVTAGKGADKGEYKTNSFGFDFDMRNIEFGAVVKF